MASPVDTSVKHYRSDMPGAPALPGQPGSKIAQLEACLCTGYGLTAVTSLVVAGGVATLSFAGAAVAWEAAVILVSGANNAALNGEQKVTALGVNQVKFATAQPDGADAGAITFKIAPAGWEKVFSATNRAAFRSKDPASSKMFLYVDETGPAKQAQLQGYENMTSIGAGTGAFPSAGTAAWPKSDTESAAANVWVLVADSMLIYDFVAPAAWRGAAYRNGGVQCFGQGLAENPAGDPYFTILTPMAPSGSEISRGVHGGISAPVVHVARSHTGLGSDALLLLQPLTGTRGGGSGTDGHFGDFPSPVSGALQLSRIMLSASQNAAVRGTLPGVFHAPQTNVGSAFKTFDTVAGPGGVLLALSVSLSSPSNASYAPITGAMFVDVTGPWR